ncbi:MAG: tyrosine-type recombinase/integrase [Firmicutes bacterium]|nr:tyrosine-type recombinase/integrase [Bacillota bacterium]
MIAMSESVENLLVQYRKWQSDMKELLANKWTDSDYVFTNDFGETIHPDSISQWFNRFIKRKGLKHITFHGLRHTAATLLISSGVDIETVSRILGHSSSAITSQVYLHSADAIRKDAMKKLDKTINS